MKLAVIKIITKGNERIGYWKDEEHIVNEKEHAFLDRVGEALKDWEKSYPSYIRNNKVQIICYEEKEIIEWQPKTKKHYTDTK